MPYIKKEDREWIDQAIEQLSINITNVGELNYAISQLSAKFVNNRVVNYEMLNSVIGVMESAKLEFYRRLVVPYEEGKIVANGDITGYHQPKTERE